MNETIPTPPPIQQRHLNQTNLSFSQESLWFLQQLDPENIAYNSNYLIKFTGKIDPPSLERAVNELVRRHEPFRATYPNKGGKPIQVIHPFEPFPLPAVDFSGLPEEEQEQAVKRYYSEQGNLPLNLQQGPVIRFTILHLAENENYLFFSTHHIGSDAWSREIVINEIMQLYDAFRSGRVPHLPDLPIQYTDYALWERQWLNGNTLTTYLDHWKNILSGDLPILELPTDRPRPAVQSSHGAKYRFQLPQALSSELSVFCKREHLTLFQPLLAAYALLLTRYTGLEDIIIGCPFANRSRPEMDGLVGLFVNTLPIRIKLSGNSSVHTFLKQVRDVMVDAFSWQAAPFEALVSKISPKRDLSHTPVFQVMITLRNVPKRQTSIEGLKVESVPPEEASSQFDLSLEFDVSEDEELECSLIYNIDLFDENTIIHMVAHYQKLLKELLAKSDCPITDLEMLTLSEWQRIVIDWNDTSADYPREKCVHQIIEEQVERTPDSLAVLFGEQQLTYRKLNERANQIAHYLRKLGAGPEVPVGMYLERSAELAITILGILKSGSPFVPLDTIYPIERRAEIIHDSGMKILVTQNALVTDKFESDLTLLCLDGQHELLETESIQNPVHVVTPENLAYIIYTSGSTGKPKGVEISHRSLVNCLLSANKHLGLSAGNISMAVFSPTFDVSVFDLLSPLCLGATVVVASKEEMYDSALLSKRILELPLTWMSASPATWRMLLETGWQGKAGLKIISTGEALPPDIANRLMEIAGEVYNLYGPTEATIWCAVMRLTPGHPVTIGRPIANTRLYILDSHLRPVPVGVVGELYIGGDGLARGYHNLPELTAEKFIRDPFNNQPGGCLFRTGDLAHFQQNGEIDVLGRSDFQVKIRGYRIELGEIETILGQYRDIRQALVVVREDLPGDKRLVAYLLAAKNATLDEGELRGFLREKLPEYMVPAVFVQVDTFPLTTSGKIDLKALPAPEATVSNKYLPPQTEEEIQLLKVWETVLGISPIGVEDGFFDIGGDSLLAIKLCMEIEKTLNVNLPVIEIFRFPTIRQLAVKLRTMPRDAALAPLRRVDRRQPIPVSFAQQSLWLQYQLEGMSNTYNLPFVYQLEGQLDISALEKSLRYMITRHEALRTSFKLINGDPYQVIAESVDWKLEVHDSDEETARKELLASASEPFSLERAPLMRVHLWKKALNKYVLLFNIHHIIFDGWSLEVFERELADVYSRYAAGLQVNLPPLELDYADYAAWQRNWLWGDELQQHLAFWQEHLKGAPELLDLPTDHPRKAVRTYRGRNISLFLTPEIVDKLGELAQREGMTLFMLLNASYAILLGRYSRQEDVVIGFPIANRQYKELEGILGFFVNMLPLRVDLSGNPGLSEFLQRVRQSSINAYAYQDAPFEKMVEDLLSHRDQGYNPIFQVASDYVNTPLQSFHLVGCDIQPVFFNNGIEKFDLSLVVRELGKGLQLELNYNIDLFEAPLIESILSHFKVVLEWMTSDPQNGIFEFDSFTNAERQQVVIDWNNTGRDFPQVCIQDLITIQSRKNPEWMAVVCNGNILTYGDLEIKANQLAHYLRANGVSAEARVGIYLPRSENTLIALLAVLKAGGAYVPIDLAYPKERITYMIEDSDPAVIITYSYLSNKLPNQIKKICLDTESVSTDACESGLPISITTNDSLAFVMYTSGSTGRPKGAMNTHKGIVNYITHMINQFQFGPSDRVIQFTPLSFDSSVWNVLGTLSYGGTVFFMDDEQMRNPDYIYTAIVDHQATYVNLVPTMLRAICESALEHKPKKNSLRLISCGGDVLREADVELACRAFGKLVNVNNQYGPTECSISAIHYLVPNALPNGLQGVPIGTPIGNARAYVLDDYLHLVPQGVKGELFIGGIGVGRGYWNRPDLTAERFLQDPFWPGGRMYRTGDIVRQLPDGTICFIGRSDYQVKIRSYRVELGEIEAIINEFSGVKDSVVVLLHQDGSDKLVAYITVSEGNRANIKEKLHGYLAERLPFYMLPSIIMQLEAMPLTVSGKVDRHALPLPEISVDTDRQHAPRNDTEIRLVSIWKEVLGIERVGIRDNFFELGGHSLLAVRLFARIQEEFGISLPLQILFNEGTVQSLAEALAQIDSPSFLQGIAPIRPEGSKAPLFIISPQLLMRELAFALAPGRPVYGLAPVENGKEVYRKSVQDTAIIYYHNLVEFYPRGPYLLIGHSGRGLFTLELARVLLQNGKDVAFLGLLDTRLHRSIPPVERLKFHTTNLLSKNLPEALQYTEISLRRFSTRAWIKILNPKTVERYQKEGRVRGQEVMNHLMRIYVSKPYPGQATLFSIANPPSETLENPKEQWADTFIGQLDIVTVPGDHVSMLKQPHVTVLAEKIDALLPPD
jgi:amino acid adenylation domain-containing protein